MTTYYLEYLKLKKKLRSWLGPIIVFILIMVAYPLTVEFLEKDLEKGFLLIAMDLNSFKYDVFYGRYIFRGLQ